MVKLTIEMGTSKLLVQYYDKNDEAALSEFFQLYRDLVFRIAYSIVNNQADADDMMQQTFIKIIQKQSICKAAYDLDDAKVKSWVLSIVYNCSRMFLRTQKLKTTQSLDEGNEMPASNESHSNQLHASDQAEINQKLKNAIFGLSEIYRVPLLMRYLEEMSIEDISKSLAANPSTVRSNLKRGLDLLRNKLSAEKMMLSSTAAIELVANMSLPVSQKTFSPSFIKSYSVAKTTSTKLAISAPAKSTLILKSIVALVILTFTSIYFLGPVIKNKISEKKLNLAKLTPINETKTLEKSVWDFSKEDGHDIKIKVGKFKYYEDLKAIKNIKDKDSVTHVILNLEHKLTNFTKINTNCIMLLSDFTKEKPISTYAIDFVPILNNKLVSGYCIYQIPKPIDLPGTKIIPYEQDIYIIDNLFVHIAKGHGIIKIFSFDNLSSEVDIGLSISETYLQKISIEPMNPELVEEIRKKAATALNQKK